MPGLFSGIEMAKRALSAHQMRLGVISHNIANASTPGYSRQEGVLNSTPSYQNGNLFLGTGVDLARVDRYRDPFFDKRALDEKGTAGQYEALRTGLEQVEGVFADLSSVGIGARLAEFWQSWNELANRPTDTATRTNVVTATRSLAASIRNTRDELSDIRQTFRFQIESTVDDINRLATEIAELNYQIHAAEVGGGQANDLRDERLRLVEELSELSGATITEGTDNMVTVRIGGRFLVDGTRTTAVRVEHTGDPEDPGQPPIWEDGQSVVNYAGQLGGLIEARDGTIVQVIADLDAFTAALIAETNAIHDDGTGTLLVFEGNDARDIEVGTAISLDPNAIRAGVGLAGDNTIAIALAGLEHDAIGALGDVTFNDYISSMVGDIGSRTREAQDLESTQAMVLLQIENVRESVSGVSLDEEAAELVMAQRAFQAAAQVVNTMDSLIETVILSIAG